jgi:hypothetical protein
MRFKQYLTQENTQSTIGEDLVVDFASLEKVNDALVAGLSGTFFSPENGIQMIRRVLAEYGYEMPALYGADLDGDELGLEVQTGLFLYLIYSIDDSGIYEFFAELTDSDGLDELLSEDDEEEIE